jgi:cysteine desulfurase/selenocysteine lyase
VFLDSAASSQKPTSVIEAMNRYYRTTHANVHRGVHTLSEEATAQYEGARAKVSQFIGACCPKEVIWTRNATEAINLVAYSWGRTNLRQGDHILLTEMEHHANLVPWQILAAEKDLVLDFVAVADDGTLRLQDLNRLLTPRTKLFAFTAASNVLGTLNPVKEMTQAAHRVGTRVLLDGAQSVPHLAVDVQDLDIDFMAFSAHKMLGPTGIGALWGRREILNAMPPFLGGGDMIREVHLRSFKPNELPWKFEAGTPPIAEAIGFGAAVEYLEAIGMDAIHAHEQEITAYAMARLSEIRGLSILGPSADSRGGLVAFTLGDIHPHDVAGALDTMGIAVRAGHHCAMPLHERLGISASARASFYVYTTRSEIDALVAGLEMVVQYFSF